MLLTFYLKSKKKELQVREEEKEAAELERKRQEQKEREKNILQARQKMISGISLIIFLLFKVFPSKVTFT
jgi:uncharacterized membrane protein